MKRTSERVGAAAPLLLLAAPLWLSGCGNQYRPVETAINPVGPATQATKYAYAIANPSSASTGLLTVVDFSGDTVLATPVIAAQPNNPLSFAVTSAGTEAFSINYNVTSTTSSATLSDIPLTSPSTLLTSSVVNTTLPSGGTPSAVIPLALTSTETQELFITEPGRNAIAVTSVGTPALIEEITVPANPTYVVGAAGATRAYALSAPTTTAAGYASAIEGSTLSVSSQIAVGIDPVYGVMTSDGNRAFILNEGSGTVNVINVPENQLDSAATVIPASGTLGTNPVWADIATSINELVVLNKGNGTTNGTLSIISIPLCSATAVSGTTACSSTDPTDATGFGTVVATVPVGVNPTMVSVLQDGTRAYVCNQGNAATGVEGSVSVVSLTSNTVTATIPAVSSSTATASESTSPTYVYGHPNTITAMVGDPTGKVYVTSSDNKFMTVIETDTDSVDTHINLQGLGVRVLRSAQ